MSSQNVLARISVTVGDITRLKVDAIVNAANSTLLGGGGVDGAIHRAAGPELVAECRTLGGCPTGEARVTRGYRLPARHVIHTVGPIYDNGAHGEPFLLASCYRSSLALARDIGAGSIAFPCISTGVFGYPKAQACETAVAAVCTWLSAEQLPEKVIFCCFSKDDAAIYGQRLSKLLEATNGSP